MVKLYDSRTKQLVEINEHDVSIYNCGPTVYNHIHIGNARPLITFDVLNRLFLYLQKEVKYVLNITDIDDKIIQAAKNEHISELELSNYYTEQYFLIKQKLNVLPMINPKVSDNIQGIIEYINQLVDKKVGYFAADGDVYFDVAQIKNYGCVSHQNPDELIVGARVQKDENKRHPQDFVLWKKTQYGIQWDSPWFRGRPGWHTECAYLINNLIGPQVTIHGGGMDLKFPHHENENAQNEALFGCSLAKVWMHVGMINIDNEKMSKSLNNFILVKDILEKYSYQALRWFFYQSGYANPLNYSDMMMNQMEEEINKFKQSINQAKSLLVLANQQIEFNHKIINHNVIEHLSDNLNLINAITEMYALNKKLNVAIRQKNIQDVSLLLNELTSTLDLLGINFVNLHNEKVISLLHEWNNYQQNKEYDEADKLRQLLVDKGVL